MNYDAKTVTSVVLGMAAFGLILWGINAIPASVPGAGIVKEVAAAAKP